VKRVHAVKLESYSPAEYGLLQCKRRLTRVRFQDRLPPYQPDKTYRLLLTTVYERMVKDPLGPLEVPERTRAEWEPETNAFVLHGRGLRGFQVNVQIHNVAEEEQAETVSETSVAALHGSRLPSLT
jgi:hypothetical protein